MSEIVQKIAIAVRQASSVSSEAGTTNTVQICRGRARAVIGNCATAFRRVCRNAILTAVRPEAFSSSAVFSGACVGRAGIMQLSLSVARRS
jgi:hypothetical protein